MRILCLRLRSRRRDAESPEIDFLRTAAELEEFSPTIGRHDWHDRWCCYLDVGGTSRWFGGEARLLAHLRRWSDERRYAAVATIADSPGAAWAVVHFGIAESAAPFTARIVGDGCTNETLSPLPVEALRLSEATTSLLRELGIATIGPLFSLPREALAERFAPELLLRLDQATGTVGEPFTPYRPVPHYEVRRTWEFGVTSTELLIAVWERLLPKLLAPLAARSRGVARLLAELIDETGSCRRLVVGMLRPSLDVKHLLDLLRLRLETVRLCEPLVGTRLSVLDEAPQAVQQQVLFSELSPPIESTAWTTLVERLSGRLGADRVVAIRSHADHDPARAWKAEPWLARSARRRAPPSRKVADSLPHLPRPTRLLPQPRPIRVFAVAPQGHPQRFDDHGRSLRVVRSWGPERIETGWWRGPSLRRDYFRVETETGAHVWIFRDLRSRRWFLHGWFD